MTVPGVKSAVIFAGLCAVGLAIVAGYLSRTSGNDEHPVHAIAAQTDLSQDHQEQRRAEPTRVVPQDRQQDASDSLAHIHRADDLYAFAQAMAVRASSGEPRAQYLLSRALSYCTVHAALVAAQPGEELDDKVASYLNMPPGVPELAAQKRRRDVARCEGFHSGNPLRDMGFDEVHSGSRYWFDAAVENRDPIALAHRATETASRYSFSIDEETRSDLRAKLLSDIRIAILSREPEAVAMVGGIMLNPALAKDQALQGPAWIVAACDLGYDCTLGNPQLGNGCAATGECLAGETMQDRFRRDLGDAAYTRVYMASIDIRNKLSLGDWDGLLQYLALEN